MKINFLINLTIFFTLNLNILHSYEIIRDPIFENYFKDISKDLKLNEKNVYLIKNISANAFVIDDNIYFTTGLLNIINNEDTLKAIYLHEYGHVIKNHFQDKKINLHRFKNKSVIYSLFSVGLAAVAGSTDFGISSIITLNSNLINEISKHSINLEIEADNFMIDQIKINKLNTSELVLFLNKTKDPNYKYFRTHPKSIDRINNLKKLSFLGLANSDKFNWLKSKYSKNSNNKQYNNFFINLEKGIFNPDKSLINIDEHIIEYEAYKKGLLLKNWDLGFQNLLLINDNSFLKLEYMNYLLDNNLIDKYIILDDLKYDKKIMNEYFYYYVYGKYYNKVGLDSLSNFHFCQFYNSINSQNKADFFCKKYDIKDIPTLDKSYAIFK